MKKKSKYIQGIFYIWSSARTVPQAKLNGEGTKHSLYTHAHTNLPASAWNPQLL